MAKRPVIPIHSEVTIDDFHPVLKRLHMLELKGTPPTRADFRRAAVELKKYSDRAEKRGRQPYYHEL